ncbi:MAG TPA: hypothetical protein VEI03_23290 [Stellaceae bacterium]|nr:hypothetical protein [Stellaceae bacterium]
MRATSRRSTSGQSASFLSRPVPPGIVAAALLLLPLVGCVSRYNPVLSDRAVMPGYSAAEVRGLAGRTIKVEVYGNPFSVAPEAFAGQVAANMNQSDAAPAHFAAHPSGASAEPYRVVWNFAPPRQSIAPNEICRMTSAPPGGGMPIDVYAAFCQGRDALSSVRGGIYYSDTQNSVEFLVLVDAMTAQLFPINAQGLRRSGDARLGKPMSHPF